MIALLRRAIWVKAMCSRFSIFRWLASAAALLAIIWLFGVLPLVSPDKMGGVSGSLLRWLVDTWTPALDMQHGWLIPGVSVYVVWRRRRELAACAGAPDWRGWLAVLAGVLLLWMGLKAEQARLYFLALVWFLWAVPFALWGAAVARQLIFPVAFLLLAMPLDTVVTFFTVRLRLLSAIVGTVVLNGLGVEVQRVGTGLHSMAGAGFNLDVADPCSGLRSIFALVALTGVYAFFTQRTLLRKWLLFACAVPLAVIGNVGRIIAIALVARWFGQETATSFFHDYSGYVVFVIAILLMMQAGVLIERVGKETAPQAVDRTPEPPVAAASAGFVPGGARNLWDLWLVSTVPLLLVAAGVLAQCEPKPQRLPIDFIATDDLPVHFDSFASDRLWFCHNAQCLRMFHEQDLAAQTPLSAAVTNLPEGMVGGPPSIEAVMKMASPFRCPSCGGRLYPLSLGEKDLLPADTILLKRDYQDGIHGALHVSVVISGASRDSIHKPENCLPAQGFRIESVDTVRVPMSGRLPLEVKRMLVAKPEANGVEVQSGVIYWFVGGAHETPWHLPRMFWTTWERARYNRAVRWVYISVGSDQPFDTPERLAYLQEFLAKWYPLVRRAPVSQPIAVSAPRPGCAQ